MFPSEVVRDLLGGPLLLQALSDLLAKKRLVEPMGLNSPTGSGTALGDRRFVE
jgi:hypothetical protein